MTTRPFHPVPRSLVKSLAALSVALLVAACGGPPAPSGAEPAGEPVRATRAVAERITVDSLIELDGRVEADRTATVAARVLATLSAIHVNAGDTVRRGQLLLEIDPDTAESQVAQARGALAQATAGLTLAESNHRRYQALAGRDAASELEVDMARTRHEQALGAVEQAEGALSAARAIAGDTRVVAPFDGYVVRRMVEVGDLAAPGRPLLMLESKSSRRLVVNVPEGSARGLAVGTTVRIAVDSRPDLGEMEGVVVEMTPGADPMSLSFEVRVELPVDGLPTGAAGRAWLPVGQRTAVVVPAAAVLRQGGLELVVIEDDEGLAASRVVRAGESRADGTIEILSGLKGGETVLTGLAAVPAAGRRVEEAGS